MSIRASELVTAYDHSLEQQIVVQGSNLVCRDEELWNKVEGLLREGDAQETHCLGLDPLREMEQSLKSPAVAPTAVHSGRVKARGGLQGLAKAFEIVEQAALNLYLGPWREEYKVVKLYSGLFTHYIKPVLSMPQIEKLFGLLGYQPNSSRHEQLCLQSPRISPASQDDLLRLSCAFFLARCECRLLLTALGKHGGEAQWELSMVRERQKGNSLQVALANTREMLEVNPPLMKPFDEEVVDLYTDEEVTERQRGTVVGDNESPCCLTWASESSASPPAVKTHCNGLTSLSSSSISLSTREDININALNCQLAKTPPLESDTTRSSSVSMKQGKRPCEESSFDKADSQSGSLHLEAMGLCKSEADVSHFCSCLHSPHICPKLCVNCRTLHSITCALLQHCYMKEHHVVYPDIVREEMEESRVMSPQGEGLRVIGMSASPTLTRSSAAMSSLVLCDDPKSMTPSPHPFSYHDCCDLTHLDPQVLCLTCSVFHSGSCGEIDTCQSHHNIKPLGVCSCGKACSRNPLILCRYCGTEYCRDCWYRDPLVCTCGQSFDQSSSV